MSASQLRRLQAALADAQADLEAAIREARRAHHAANQAGAIARMTMLEADDATLSLQAAKKKVDRAVRIAAKTKPDR